MQCPIYDVLVASLLRRSPLANAACFADLQAGVFEGLRTTGLCMQAVAVHGGSEACRALVFGRGGETPPPEEGGGRDGAVRLVELPWGTCARPTIRRAANAAPPAPS